MFFYKFFMQLIKEFKSNKYFWQLHVPIHFIHSTLIYTNSFIVTVISGEADGKFHCWRSLPNCWVFVVTEARWLPTHGCEAGLRRLLVRTQPLSRSSGRRSRGHLGRPGPGPRVTLCLLPLAQTLSAWWPLGPGESLPPQPDTGDNSANTLPLIATLPTWRPSC